MYSIIFVLLVGPCLAVGKEEDHSDSFEALRFVQAIQRQVPSEWLETPTHWRNLAKEAILSKERQGPLEAVAKNGIFFIGDGMGITSVSAARVFKGQRDDGARFGEESSLHMETFPYSGLSKTYCLDTQVADSSCSATAYLCGIKARFATAGLTPGVVFADCRGQNNTDFHVTSIVEWAQREGKSTGVVTSGRVTAIPGAANWAGIARRSWETDADVAEWGMNPEVCPDIGIQLLRKEAGQRLNVLLGGGRHRLTPVEKIDQETNSPGKRTDGRNIAEEWLIMKSGQTGTARYITGRDELLELNLSEVDHLLGSFAMSELPWSDELERNNDPTMAEMVEVAIKILSKNPKGFFLFVHGSKIDSAHHSNRPGRAMREIVEFDKSVKKGDDMTDDLDTLIVVSADHSHTMGYSGYNVRGNPILRHSIIPADDGFVFSTLNYANGPGPAWINPDTGLRHNVLLDNTTHPNYELPVPVPLFSEAHASEDVPIFAKGPYAHYFAGVQEQSSIPHLMAYALCVGDGLKNRYCLPGDETTTEDSDPISDTTTFPTTPSSASTYGLVYCLVLLTVCPIFHGRGYSVK
ncbi:Membrane-bound alkaline phosphatase [Folsomia candida]|uniref:Alkaline phosphatase n=1 Tax=Folsomia candida TaxID=158441 RepID=A0A226DD58_FOLCA|nr:Membrane-bound alkaline phosphatase [Folsomia candida]